MNTRIVSLTSLFSILLPGTLRAELWRATDTVPRPNMLVTLDTSVTMGIDTTCDDCHGGGDERTRLEIAKRDLLQTMPLFRDYFLFGGINYNACDFAKIGRREVAITNDAEDSYRRTLDLVQTARHCDERENFIPGQPGVAWTNCITASDNCTGDPAVVERLVDGDLTGFSLTLPPVTTVACTVGAMAGQNLDLEAVAVQFFGSQMQWPRWNPTMGGVVGGQILNEFCTPIATILNSVWDLLAACTPDPWAAWPGAPAAAAPGGRPEWGQWCNPGLINVNACRGGSPLSGTCVCDQSDPRCVSVPPAFSECGVQFTWKARQQVAVCETYDEDGAFGTFFRGQGDNILNPGGCRENNALFFTDGHMGHTAGVAAEALSPGCSSTYASPSGQRNMFVFHVSNQFIGEADRMMTAVTNGLINQRFETSETVNMQESFAKVLSRSYKGVYSGAAMGLDSYGTRAAFHSFTVPGFNLTGPSDRYLGFPARIAWHAVGATGAIDPDPIFETDWADKVLTDASCGDRELGGLDVVNLGPGGTFRNAVDRWVEVAADSVDRNGDRVVDAADDHPPLRWGGAYSFAATRPVVVEYPREAPDPAFVRDFLTHQEAVRNRPRMIYVEAGGYVLGYHAGSFLRSDGTARYGGATQAVEYDDRVTDAGRLVLRYRPRWLNDPTVKYAYDVNALIQQPILTGELVAREVRIDAGGREQYRTVLAGSHGKEGPGYFVLDISDPCRPSILSEWVLPARSYASAAPAIYEFPMSAGNRRRPTVITTSGYDQPVTSAAGGPAAVFGGEGMLYAYDIVTGGLIASADLPRTAGTNYATAPVCLDSSGEGVITYCYALRDDGLLARVPVLENRFGAAVDVTPVDRTGARVTTGFRFYASPVAFFGADGAVNLAFGSGNFRDLTNTSESNRLFRVRDATTRRARSADSPLEADGVCQAQGEDTRGVIDLPPGQRAISPPLIAGGVVAFTTYRPESNGCVAGSSFLYAMDFNSCADAVNPNNARPAAIPLGNGIASTPVLHRPSQRLLVQSSAGPTADLVSRQAVRVRGGARPYAKRLYWRLELDNP